MTNFRVLYKILYMTLEEGREFSINGKIFEEEVANIINTKSPKEYYDKIKDVLNLSGTEKATADRKLIGRLKSGGNPKTDVIADDKTISCKKTSCKFVSAHEYDYKKFVEVLDPNNKRLEELLKEFQRVGGVRAFGKNNEKELTEVLKPYKRKLIEWVLSGYTGDIKNQSQLAKFIITTDEKDIYVHTVEDYIDILMKEENEAQFGTPFSWTYPSKRKGEKIQLKVKVIK